MTITATVHLVFLFSFLEIISARLDTKGEPLGLQLWLSFSFRIKLKLKHLYTCLIDQFLTILGKEGPVKQKFFVYRYTIVYATYNKAHGVYSKIVDLYRRLIAVKEMFCR